jgi:co-chaperonin GroES (HSP10)
VRPLRDHILVKPDPIAGHVSKRIVVNARTVGTGENHAGSREQLGRTGTVVAVGPGKTTRKGVQHSPALSVGDRVLFGEWDYPEVPALGPDRLLVLSWQDICGIIENE